MKKFLIRLAKFTGVLFLLLFLTAFIWANWEEPGPGAKAPVVNFLQYDASNIKDTATIIDIQDHFKKENGIKGVTYNSESELLVFCYNIDQIDQETIDADLNSQFHLNLKEKRFVKTGPKCPIDVAYISKVKHFLCVRD